MNTRTLFLLPLMVLALASPAFAQNSVIRISFADSDLPDINVSGKISTQPYGVSDTPKVARARAEVALKTPPPILEAFAIQWQPLHTVQETILRNSPPESPYGDFSGLSFYFNLDEPRSQSVDHQSEFKALPEYDTEEYLAQLAEWKREQVRARMMLDP
ncbi:MAG: hypothetical protein ABFD69_02645 [Candidatus Sumerlaeia bacterium]